MSSRSCQRLSAPGSILVGLASGRAEAVEVLLESLMQRFLPPEFLLPGRPFGRVPLRQPRSDSGCLAADKV